MKPALVAMSAVVLFALFPLHAIPQAAKGSIEGVVTRAGSGEPIVDAQITLTRLGGLGPGGVAGGVPGGIVGGVQGGASVAPGTTALPPALGPATISAPVSTDWNGRFTIKDLEAGNYRISIASEGYVKQEYGQRAFPGQGTPVSLAAGQAVKDLVIRLTPTGTVSGRVRDQSGRPVVDTSVQLLKSTYNANGQRALSSAGTVRSNDRGEYRLYWITPGRYLLVAGSEPGPPNRPAALGGGAPNPNATGESFALTFYPGVPDMNLASTLDVQAGSELTGVDLMAARQPMRQVRGRVIDSRTGQPPPNVSISLAYRNISGSGGGSFSSGQNYNAATGTFELRNVVAGSYVVQAQIQEALPRAAIEDIALRAAATANRVSASAPITVGAADVEGIVLTLAPGASITGRLMVDTQGTAAVLNPTSIRVQLRTEAGGVSNSTPTVQPTNADGTFNIDGIQPGEYQVAVIPIPPDFYLKEARFDQTDVLGSPLKISGASSGTLNIVLSSKPAEISGTVVDSRLQPVQGIQAVLVPERQRTRVDLFKSMATSATGAFTFRGVPPGDYRLFAWEAIETYSWFDPEVLRRFETQGTLIHVAESQRETTQIRVIAAP